MVTKQQKMQTAEAIEPNQLKSLKTMKEGEFEKIITEWNANVKELPPKIVELPKTKNGNIVDKIDKKDITFVVSGTWKPDTITLKEVLFAIRDCFPESKIILSTWDDFDEKKQKEYTNLYDELILSSQDELPYQNIPYHKINDGSYSLLRTNSFNHQQLLNSRALEKVETKYVVKTRTDIFIKDDTFLRRYIKFSNKIPLVDENYRIFKQRILCDNTFMHNPQNSIFKYRLSDLFHFGLTEDIKKMWNYSVMPEDVADYSRRLSQEDTRQYLYIKGRFFAEQYFLHCLIMSNNKHFHLPYNYKDNSEILDKDYARFIANNVICLPCSSLNVFTRFGDNVYKHSLNLKCLNEMLSSSLNGYDVLKKDALYEEVLKQHEKTRASLKNYKSQWKANSVVIYPVSRIIRRLVKSLILGGKIIFAYPYFFVNNWKRHKLKSQMKNANSTVHGLD